jgi:hypothetical protein
MKNTICLIGLLAAAILSASGQDAKPLPPKTIAEAMGVRGMPAIPEGATQARHPQAAPANLFFCPPKGCLYYSGDWDCNSNSNNALFDFDNPGIGVSDAEVWVGVKPARDAVITGTSGNYVTNADSIGINPTPFLVRQGISPGSGGKLVCSTHWNAVTKVYGNNCQILNSLNYSIAKLARACHVKAGKTYYIDLTPQYNDSMTEGFLWDVDKKAQNHKGWRTVLDESYFNSSTFGGDFEPTWGSEGACGGFGCDAFSVSLTGTQK